jgi:hypothetical protein
MLLDQGILWEEIKLSHQITLKTLLGQKADILQLEINLRNASDNSRKNSEKEKNEREK